MANFYTHAGKAITTGRMLGATPAQAEPKYVDWGTGAGAASASSTTLSTAGGESRTSGTGSQVTTSQTNDTHQIVGTITATGSKTITNAGVFDASTTGNLYVIGDGLSIALLTGDSIQFTFKVQYT